MTLARTPFWAVSTRPWIQDSRVQARSMRTHVVSVEWPSICVSKSLLLQVMTACGRFGTWKLVKTSWLARVTRIGSAVLISIQQALTWLRQEVTEASNFGTLCPAASLTLSPTLPPHPSSRQSSMTLETSFSVEMAPEQSNFLTFMPSNWGSNIALTQTLSMAWPSSLSQISLWVVQLTRLCQFGTWEQAWQCRLSTAISTLLMIPSSALVVSTSPPLTPTVS